MGEPLKGGAPSQSLDSALARIPRELDPAKLRVPDRLRDILSVRNPTVLAEMTRPLLVNAPPQYHAQVALSQSVNMSRSMIQMPSCQPPSHLPSGQGLWQGPRAGVEGPGGLQLVGSTPVKGGGGREWEWEGGQHRPNRKGEGGGVILSGLIFKLRKKADFPAPNRIIQKLNQTLSISSI